VANEAAQLLARLGADVSPLQRDLGSASGLLRRFASTGGQTLSTLGKGLLAGAGIGLGIAAFGGLTSAIGGATNAAFNLNSQLEQSDLAFTTMLGSAEKADALLGQLQQFALQTPFEFPDLVTASQRMLAYGFSAQQVLPILKSVGDAAAGLGAGNQGINRITLALGQMQARGKVAAQEMLQLTEVGIPAWDILAEKMGVSVATLQDMVTKGLVPADRAIEAITRGMDERFGGLMESQSETFQGAMANATEGAQRFTAQGLYPLFNVAKVTANQMADFFQSETAQRWANVLAGAVKVVIDFLGHLGRESGKVLSLLGRAFAALDDFLGNPFKRTLEGLDQAVNTLADIGMEQLSDSVYTAKGDLGGFADEADTTSRAVDNLNKSLTKTRSVIDDIFQPSQASDFTDQLDAMGAHVDTWDENARRMADIAARGSDSPWLSFFDIPQDVLQGGEDALKLWATRWQRSFYLGFLPEQINTEAVLNRYKELLASKQAWDSIKSAVEAQIKAQGLAWDEDLLSQAFGGSGGGGSLFDGKDIFLPVTIKTGFDPSEEDVMATVESWSKYIAVLYRFKEEPDKQGRTLKDILNTPYYLQFTTGGKALLSPSLTKTCQKTWKSHSRPTGRRALSVHGLQKKAWRKK